MAYFLRSADPDCRLQTAFPPIVPGSTAFHKRSRGCIGEAAAQGLAVLVQCETRQMNRAASAPLLSTAFQTWAVVTAQKVLLTAEQIRAWGRRIPFVIVAALEVRRGCQQDGKRDRTLRRCCATRAKSCWLSDCLPEALPHATPPAHAEVPQAVGRPDDNQTTIVSVRSLIFADILQPIHGASDHIERKGGGRIRDQQRLTTLQVSKGLLRLLADAVAAA